MNDLRNEFVFESDVTGRALAAFEDHESSRRGCRAASTLAASESAGLPLPGRSPRRRGRERFDDGRTAPDYPPSDSNRSASMGSESALTEA